MPRHISHEEVHIMMDDVRRVEREASETRDLVNRFLHNERTRLLRNLSITIIQERTFNATPE